jgi:RimJ/RimL family protein N-acetyltransferase
LLLALPSPPPALWKSAPFDPSHLRPVSKEDLPLFFEHACQSNLAPASDRAGFVEEWQRMLDDETVQARTVVVEGRVAGYTAHFAQLGKPAISYWLDRRFWNRGIATEALNLFLPLVSARPLFARVAVDNPGSLRVLEKLEFQVVGRSAFFSERHGHEIEEIVLTLDTHGGTATV